MSDATAGRGRLLELVVDYVLANGTEVTLRGLAREIGSNNRMLLYYFESKDALLNEACVEALTRFPHLNGMMQRLQTTSGPLDERLRRAWQDIAHPDNLPFLILFFELFGVALHHPERYGAFIDRISGRWTEDVRRILVADGVDAERALLQATGIVGLWRGLQTALISGAPRQVLDDAYDDAIRRIVA